MTLSAWLIQQAGGHFDKPGEVIKKYSSFSFILKIIFFFYQFDDPNTVVSGILNTLRKYVIY